VKKILDTKLIDLDASLASMRRDRNSLQEEKVCTHEYKIWQRIDGGEVETSDITVRPAYHAYSYLGFTASSTLLSVRIHLQWNLRTPVGLRNAVLN
jgi:hypothetical protein